MIATCVSPRHPRAVWALCLLAAGLALTGCAGGSDSTTLQSPTPAQPAGPPPAPAAAIATCNQTEIGCSSASAYSLATLRDLSVTVNWTHLPAGTHAQTLEFLDPKGGLFDVRNVAFAVASDDAMAQTNVLLPIAGTFITRRSITGQWSVRVTLDGQSAQLQSFVFQP